MYFSDPLARRDLRPAFINNYAYVYIVDRLKRVKGIGDVRVFGSEFGMRIWLRARSDGEPAPHGRATSRA